MCVASIQGCIHTHRVRHLHQHHPLVRGPPDNETAFRLHTAKHRRGIGVMDGWAITLNRCCKIGEIIPPSSAVFEAF